jgi:hypothetical protein
MLFFGGNNFDAVNELFSFDVNRREWSRIKPEGAPPSKRYGHASVATNDGRMIVFGGYNGSFLNDVHELTLGGGADEPPRWRCVATSGTSPTPRDGHSAVLAPDGRTLLVYGGFDGETQLGDLHALDIHTFAWAAIDCAPAAAAPDGAASDAGASAADATAGGTPPPRYLHCAVACDDGMLVYGGYLAGGAFGDDLWRLTRRATSEGGGAADEGGDASSTAEDSPQDVETEDIHDESDEADEGGDASSTATAASQAAEDSPQDVETEDIHDESDEADGGGGAFGAAAAAASAAEVEPARWSWTRVQTSGDAPGGLFGHAGAVDATGRLWLSGGFGEGSFSGRLHLFEPDRRHWSLVRARGALPSPRHKHTLVAVPARAGTGAVPARAHEGVNSHLFLFGGNDFGPTRGFFELDIAEAAAATLSAGARGAARGAARLLVAQLLQLLTLLALLLTAWFRQLGLMSAATTALTLPAAAVCLVAAEALAPRPGALLGRVWALRVGGAAAATRAQRRGERRVERRSFARSALASATDVAAALVTASWAVLLAGGGGQAKWSMSGAAAGGGDARQGARKVSERVAAELATLSRD